jgi:hypothetical protein
MMIENVNLHHFFHSVALFTTFFSAKKINELMMALKWLIKQVDRKNMNAIGVVSELFVKGVNIHNTKKKS